MKLSNLNQRVSAAAVKATKNNRKKVTTSAQATSSKAYKAMDKPVSMNFALKAKK